MAWFVAAPVPYRACRLLQGSPTMTSLSTSTPCLTHRCVVPLVTPHVQSFTCAALLVQATAESLSRICRRKKEGGAPRGRGAAGYGDSGLTGLLDGHDDDELDLGGGGAESAAGAAAPAPAPPSQQLLERLDRLEASLAAVAQRADVRGGGVGQTRGGCCCCCPPTPLPSPPPVVECRRLRV